MITFEDVRTEGNETYLFLPKGVISQIRWFLRQNGIEHRTLGWKKVMNRTAPEVKDVSDDDIEVFMEPFRKAGYPTAAYEVLVTHFNVDDMLKKVIDIITGPPDPDYQAYEEMQQRAVDREADMYEKMYAKK